MAVNVSRKTEASKKSLVLIQKERLVEGARASEGSRAKAVQVVAKRWLE